MKEFWEPIIVNNRNAALALFLKWAVDNGYAHKMDFSTPIAIEKVGIEPMHLPIGEIFVMKSITKVDI